MGKMFRQWLMAWSGLRRWAGLALALAASSLPFSVPAMAADLPSRPIRFVVSFTPGAGPDIVARALADVLGRKWSQAPIVENRLGADGAIATEQVARAPADGSTLLLATMGNIALLQVAQDCGLLPAPLGHDAAQAYRTLRRIQHKARLNEEPTHVALADAELERQAGLAVWRAVFA